MQTRPTVLYCGPDATTVRERWDATDRPFALVGLEPGELRGRDRFPDDTSVDCVVVDRELDRDTEDLLADVRACGGSVPVLLVTRGVVSDPTDIAPTAVDGQVTVPATVDPVELLEALRERVTELVGMHRDRALLSSLLANIPMSVYIKDGLGRHVAVSDAMFGMFDPAYIRNDEGKRHHQPADILGKTDFDLYDDELAERARDTERTVIETGDAFENQVERVAEKHESEAAVLTSKAPWYDHTGTARGIVGVTQDITERRDFERRLQRQNERLRQLTTLLSEGIRDPLSTALGRLRMARDERDRQHFDAIERSFDRIESLVDTVLEIARQGQPVTDPEPIGLEDASRWAWERLTFPEASLSIRTDAVVEGDPGRVQLLFEHLFANAIEHGPDGPGAAITVTVDTLADGSGFYVADDGVGMAPEESESTFDLDAGHEQSGIGLNVVAAIADAHNWAIDVTNSEEGGARIEFRDVDFATAPPTESP